MEEAFANKLPSIDYASVLNALPVIESVYLGQVTFLNSAVIANVAKEHRSTRLYAIHVIDAYKGSIWGPRVRLEDIEQHARGQSEAETPWIQSIRRIVRCNGKTERFEGGDRMTQRE